MFLEIFLTLLALLVSRTLWRRWKYDVHKIPSLPSLPLIGHTFSVLGNRGESELLRFLGMTWQQLGQPRIFKVNFVHQQFVFLHDLEAARQLLAHRDIPARRSAFTSNFLAPLTGNDVAVKELANVDEVTPYVKAVRRVYANGLQSHCLKAKLPKLHRVLDKLIEVIEVERQKGPIEFQELCTRMTLDAIGLIALDTNLGGLDNSQPLYQLMVDAGHICITRAFNVFKIWRHKLLPFLESARKEQATIDALNKEWRALTDKILARDDPPAGDESIWCGFKTLIDPETGRGLEFDQLVGEIAGVTVGGMDTTGHQLAFVLALVASAPNVCDRIVAELKEHGLDGPECREMTLEDLSKLVYLAAVVKEGIRLSHVVGCSFERVLKEDACILGYRLPRGTAVATPSLRWTSSESEWDDPDEFKPERWLTGEDFSRKFYMPFGHGPRDCAGQKLALLEMRVTIARLVQCYHLKLSRPIDDVLLDCCLGVVAESVPGIWLHAERRS